ncbi:hypothetical protein DYB37_003189 [Aphanomyces astaci]|uniref:DUF3730 domain-containing protein n=1 Tax=Aphanomyces astaci TaxID=112090 RepID=A0A418E2P0_APHAT|nr:hypothetical protein DYB37_003189 [Aphanomyces astaci]
MADNALFTRKSLLHHVSRVASLPTLSDEKAEYVGYALAGLAFSIWTNDDDDNDDVNKSLSRVWQGHAMVLVGVTAYVEETLVTLPSADRQVLLSCFRQLFVRTLGSPATSPLVKQTVASAIVRIGWSVDVESQRIFVVQSLLLRTIQLLPIDSNIASTMLLSTVDLGTSIRDATTHAAIASTLLSRLPHVQGRGALHLLLALESLVTAAPAIAWDVDVNLVGVLALVVAKLAAVDQAILLRVLRVVLNAAPAPGSPRHVYAEVLFAPLLQLLPASASHLQQLQHVTSHVPFQPRPPPDAAAPTSTLSLASLISPHVSLVHLLSSSVAVHSHHAEAWLDAATRHLTSSVDLPFDPDAVLVTCALLFHPSPAVQDAAIAAAKASVLAWPAAGRMLVPCIVYALAIPRPSSSSVLALLHVLLAAATDSDCMKTILKTIHAFADVPSTKALALRLLYQVWTLESRVYPRLEEMLATSTTSNDEADVEWQVCQLYTILQLCQVRGDLGLNFIATIQQSLEHALPSVAAMAVACVRALCVGDCLDFAAACKILATKQRKKKPPFLDQLWAFATAAHPSVRLAAVEALTQFPLHWIGLKAESAADLNAAPSEAEDAEVEQAIDRLLLVMTDEVDPDVRQAIDRLVERVGQDEAKLPRKRFVAERTSTGATREMRNLLPTHSHLRLLYSDTVPRMLRQALAGAVLTSFVSPTVDDSVRKRKDKLIKHMHAMWEDATALKSQLREDAGTSECNAEWPLQLALVVGWEQFTAQYLSLRHELDDALRPGASDDNDRGIERLAVDLVAQVADASSPSSSPNDLLMLGVLARRLPSELHVLSNHIVELLLRSLSLSLVKSSDGQAASAVDGPHNAIVALGLAAQGALGLHEHRVDEIADKLVGILRSPDDAALAPACLLALGHVVQSLMFKQIAPELMRRLFATLVRHLVEATVVVVVVGGEEVDISTDLNVIPNNITDLATRSNPNKAKISAAVTALALASEGCMVAQQPQWLMGLRELLLALYAKGFSEVLTALPVVLLQCLQFDLIGWKQVDSFVDLCVAGLDDPEALVALPYLLCRTQPLGHVVTSPDVTSRKLLTRLMDVATDPSRQFTATARAYATLGLANLLGVGLAIDVRPTSWKGMLVSRVDAEKAIACVTSLASLCPIQRVRIYAAWALGAIASVGTSGDATHVSGTGMDAGLQLPPSSITYKLLDHLRQVKQFSAADANWVASALTGLAACQIPTFHYATLVQRLLKAGLGDDVALSVVSFAFRHCVQDPSLLSFVLEMTSPPRFQHLSPALQASFVRQVPALAKLVPPTQLHTILSALLVAIPRCRRHAGDESRRLFELMLEAIPACASAAASPAATAVCTDMLLDGVFAQMIAATTSETMSLLPLFRAFTVAVFKVDPKQQQAKRRFIDLLRLHQQPDHAAEDDADGVAACVCLLELFHLGGVEPKELRGAVLPYLASCTTSSRSLIPVETLVLHAAASLGQLQPNDQLLWLLDLVNWIGLKLSSTSNATQTPSSGLLLVLLLGALCVRWSPVASTQAQWLWLSNPDQVPFVANVLPAAFAQVLVKLHAQVDAHAVRDLVSQLLVLVQQRPQQQTDTCSVHEAMVVYAYVVPQTQLCVDAAKFIDHFCS